MTNPDTLMNSSLAAVAETDFQPFTDLNAGRQRKVLSVRNLSKAYRGSSTRCWTASALIRTPVKWSGSLAAPAPVNRRSCMFLNGTHSASGGRNS